MANPGAVARQFDRKGSTCRSDDFDERSWWLSRPGRWTSCRVRTRTLTRSTRIRRPARQSKHLRDAGIPVEDAESPPMVPQNEAAPDKPDAVAISV